MEVIIYILAMIGLFIKWFFIALVCIITGIVLSTLLEDCAIRSADKAMARRFEKERQDREGQI